MIPRAELWALALGVLLASGCASRPAGLPAPVEPPVVAVEPPVAPAPPRRDVLAGQLDAVLAHPTFARAQTAFLVRSLATGETLYARNPATWLVPASTMKVLTSVAAAERLGWRYRFQTRLYATGPVENGTLRGDLLVVGSGDPSINPRHPDRADAFDQWARQLRALGIRHIGGHVVGDDSAVEQPGWGIGWAWDDLVEGYGAAYAALQFHEGEVRVTIGPGWTPGAPATVYLSPANHGLFVVNEAVTAAAGADGWLTLARDPGTRFLTVTGRAPLGAAPRSAITSVANPTLFFTEELRATLLRHGIVVDGAAADIDALSERPRADESWPLLVDESPPLVDLVDVTLKWSRNEYAEALLMALDPEPPATAGDAVRLMRDTLSGLGVDPGGYTTRDGSGLSRNDYLSAEALVQTLTAAWERPHLRDPLRSTLPQAGRSGSLADRLRGTAADGRVYAKTGSMSNVRSLAGYVETTAGEPLVFGFLVNGFDVGPRDVDDRVDELLLALVGLPPASR
ncbi:MAG: D-alanyl-D-alanine carboxypeptidase/D-alanyl-D-alanine-endopeptidase [Vicinamibacterales bacterium]